MQFVANGPDIPDALVQAHEEGHVVFFCGAGISYPAGLPGFDGLVRKIYEITGTVPSDLESAALDRKQFDAALDLLERRLPGQHRTVRHALAQALAPRLRRKSATETHAALLRLGRNREGRLRLVTTNFDRMFHAAGKRAKQAFDTYAAPTLPIPKNSRWNGLVFLHGLLPEKLDDAALNRLVVTSGDFGLAYLTERWAARFVSELFRGYTVCFVGYSISDPVLRYMMDALAADRRSGEVLPNAWAFVDCEPGADRRKATEWDAKGVTPILYEVPTGSHDHRALHNTLREWSRIYRDGVSGKEHIVVSHALAKPSASTAQDDFVGRMLWALSDKSGLPAKQFAEFDPAPSLEWLDALSDERFQHGDLVRFCVPPRGEVDPKLRFSLIRRPAPYDYALPMSLVTFGNGSSGWDPMMSHLAAWLLRHLDDPKLAIWIAGRGGQLDIRWRVMIEQRLDHLASLARDDKRTELDELRARAPNAIPGPLMQTVWRVILSGRVKSPQQDTDLYTWRQRFKRDGLTATARFELRELLSPRIVLKEPFRWNAVAEDAGKPTRIKQLVDWELVLTANYAHSALHDLADDRWASALPQLLQDFQQLLIDELDLLRELGEGNEQYDRSHWDLPSISPHWQNHGFHDWVCLIELLRDAWLKVRDADSVRAARVAQTWFDLPYPTFKRLALFAASQDGDIVPEQWVGWLLTDRAWWLWSMCTGREVFRLLAVRGPDLTVISQVELEAAILAGPPREMFKVDLEPAEWQRLVARSVWLHLSKLNASGIALGTEARARLVNLSNANPEWKLAPNERDEFSHWMSGTGDPDFEASRDIERAPHKRSELVSWLRKPVPERQPFHGDTWEDVCRHHMLNALYALCDLSREGTWPIQRWREALQVWSDKKLIARSWRYAAPLVQTMPESELQELVHSVTWWIEAASSVLKQYEDILLDICRRVLRLPLSAGSAVKNGDGEPLGEPVTEAINHPIGHVAQTLLNLWLQREPNDEDRLPANIEPLFTRLCDVGTPWFIHGRVLLASRAIALYRVDQQWATKNMLPLFDWRNTLEAKAAWGGFLWSPRLYQPLLIALKSPFLECASRFGDLGNNAARFAAFLTYAALGPLEGFTPADFRSAIGALPTKGLEASAQAISQALQGAGEQREDYWRNRVRPFWHNIWPKSRASITPRISEELARMATSAGSQFPDVVTTVQDWLQPIEYPHFILHLLEESALCQQFPNDALRFLSLVIGEPRWVSDKLMHSLDQISQANPLLTSDPAYRRLFQIARQ